MRWKASLRSNSVKRWFMVSKLAVTSRLDKAGAGSGCLAARGIHSSWCNCVWPPPASPATGPHQRPERPSIGSSSEQRVRCRNGGPAKIYAKSSYKRFENSAGPNEVGNSKGRIISRRKLAIRPSKMRLRWDELHGHGWYDSELQIT